MPLDNTESLDSRVRHHKNQSTLQKRRPSKEEDEEFLAEVSTSLHAAKLRSQVPEDKLLTYHTPVEFSWKQFWATLVYENLPPVLLSPIAVLLIERSFSRAWHVMNHRSLLALSREHNSVGSIIGFWVVLYPIMWVIPAALLLKLFGPEHLVQNVDLFQIILAYLFLFVRNLIISVKYGYFRPEDYEQLSRPVPHWDEDRTNRRLVGGGWSNPGKFPGLIEDELTCAMDENDVALQGISFKMKEEVSERLRSHPTDELFTAETSHNAKDEVTTGFVLHQIVSKVYNLKQPTIYMIIILLATLAVMSSTFILRKVYGLSAFGETTWETIIFIGCFLGFLASLPNFVFGFICAFDFQRRAMTLKKLGELILHPGVRLSEFLHQKPLLEDENTPEQDDPKIKTNDSAQSGSDNPQVFIDLRQSDNVFAWMICRMTLRSFGEAFYLRIQAYTSIFLFYAICCVLLLNMIGWMQLRHHVSTLWLLMLIVVAISSICIFAISKASKLQALSSVQLDQVKKELFFLEKELADTVPDHVNAERQEILRAKALLTEVDECINFHELIHKPTRVMGYPATHNVIGSSLGIILTGFVLAVEGFSGSGIAYDANGWFNY